MPRSSARSNDDGTYTYSLTEFACPDWIDLANAFARGPQVPGVVSFELQFAPKGEELTYVHRPSLGDPDRDTYSIKYRDADCVLTWSATNDLGFSFQSYATDDPRLRPGTIFGIVGRERNGVFTPPA